MDCMIVCNQTIARMRGPQQFKGLRPMSNWKERAGRSPADDVLADTGRYAANTYDYHLMIDVVSRMFTVSTFELRYYELLGLIRREFTGDGWTYSWAHCERIALIVRGRQAGLRLRDLRPLIVAMDDGAPQTIIDNGKTQALALMRRLQAGKEAHDRALDELTRIDWELSERLGVAFGECKNKADRD
jgi:DNA-binding transcriptional MerR regulator